jgi:hypothetical protein
MKVWIKNNRIKTHCESCWQWHPECAINLLCEHISDLEQIGDELVSFINHSSTCPVSSYKWAGQPCNCFVAKVVKDWKEISNTNTTTNKDFSCLS